jgi:hypothetical protein
MVGSRVERGAGRGADVGGRQVQQGGPLVAYGHPQVDAVGDGQVQPEVGQPGDEVALAAEVLPGGLGDLLDRLRGGEQVEQDGAPSVRSSRAPACAGR